MVEIPTNEIPATNKVTNETPKDYATIITSIGNNVCSALGIPIPEDTSTPKEVSLQ